MQPKVSIIVPIYNVEAYLRACLDSVMAQSERNWECLMVDDCSTDSSAAIAREYLADHRFILYSTERNSGQSVARNLGLDQARGEYICFLDSDDALMPDCLEVLLEAGNVDIAIGSSSHGRGAGFKNLSGREACLHALYQSPALPMANVSVCGRLFRASLFNDLRFEPGVLYEDLGLMPRLYLRAKTVAATSRQVYQYTVRPESSTHKVSPKRLDVLKITRSLDDEFSADPELARAARDRRMSACFNMFVMMQRNGMGSRSEADECWRQICRLRADSFKNPRVRLKNKIGILASCLGRRVFTALVKLSF